jgi:hypothetical protein
MPIFAAMTMKTDNTAGSHGSLHFYYRRTVQAGGRIMKGKKGTV